MDDNIFRIMFLGGGGGIGSAMDLVSAGSFFTVAIIYFVAPAIGYRIDRRGPLAFSLYLLVCYATLSLLQILLMFMEQDRPGMHAGGGSGNTILFAFLMLKMLVFVASLLIFVVGLQSLRMGGKPLTARGPREVYEVEEVAESGESDAEEATRQLARAQRLVDQDRADEAIELLEALLRNYPSTKAAITARVTLRRLRSSE